MKELDDQMKMILALIKRREEEVDNEKKDWASAKGNLFEYDPLSDEETQKLLRPKFQMGSTFNFGNALALAPNVAELAIIPGWDSDTARKYDERPREYYNLLLLNFAQLNGEAEAFKLLEQTKKRQAIRVRANDKAEAQKAEHVKKMNEIPLKVMKLIPKPTAESCQSMQDFEDQLTLHAFSLTIESKHEFSVVGPCSIHYGQKQVTFVGLETYTLSAIDAAGWTFKAKDAGGINLVNLTEHNVTTLFGDAPMRHVQRLENNVRKYPDVAIERAKLEDRLTKERYKNTEIEYGSW